MTPVDEMKLPPAGQGAARRSSRRWTTGTRRRPTRPSPRWPAPRSADEVFELFARYGCRDFRDIGHKAIYVANAFRTLRRIGWQHAEPVLRSLAYALLEHEGDEPGQARTANRTGPAARNAERRKKLQAEWQAASRPPRPRRRCSPRVRTASDATN